MNTSSTTTISNPVLDFFAFLRRPDAARVSASLKQKLLFLAAIIALDILFSFAANLLSASVEGLIPAKAEHVGRDDSETFFLGLLTGVFMVPVFEEITFRLWLVANPFLFFVSFVLTAIQMGVLIPFPFTGLLTQAGIADAEVYGRIALYVAVGAFITVAFWVRERRGYPYVNFFRRYVAVYYYASSILFGFAHLANYGYNVEPWWYAPFIVLPQLIGGFVFGYVCIRLGFLYAVLAHMSVNLLMMLGDGMGLLLDEAGGIIWLAILILSSLLIAAAAFRRRLVSVEKVAQ